MGVMDPANLALVPELLVCSFVGSLANVIYILSKARAEEGCLRPDWSSIGWGLVSHTLLGPLLVVLAPLVEWMRLGSVLPPESLSLIGGFFSTRVIDAIMSLRKIKESYEGFVKGYGWDMNSRQRDILKYLRGAGSITNDDCQRICKVSDSSAQSDLADLLKKGYIIREGRTRGVRYRLG